jgi:cytochrome P450
MTNGHQTKARSFPLLQTLPGLAREPLAEIERMSRVSDGELFTLDLGASRPFVVTRPDDVQHVLRENAGNYRRDGIFWRPLRRLFGESILSDGAEWQLSRKSLQPVFTTRNVNALADRMAETINGAVESLEIGAPLHITSTMADVVNQTVLRVFFGEKISAAQATILAPAFEAVATSFAVRFLLPFLPESLPVPGDRSFRSAVKVIDEVMYELVERYRADPGTGDDVFSALCQTQRDDGSRVEPGWIRDNLVAMFATGTETTTVALTWLWPLISTHPDVEARLRTEIKGVVGTGPVRPEHVAELPYTGQVVQEMLRLYPVGWLFPRVAVEADVVGGVPIKPGATVLISPYLTHRLESVWEQPERFDPDRFAPGAAGRRHRYAYFPFGGGPHQCIGMHVFNLEAQLIIASMLSRFSTSVEVTGPLRPRMGASLRPNQELEMTLERL